MSMIEPAPEAFGRTRQKQPRIKEPTHLDRVRQCSCLSCGTWAGIEAAHLRAGDRRFQKRETGGQERPSDMWALPLCGECHRTGPGAQHRMSETGFWQAKGIDPFLVAAALWCATENVERMQAIVIEARRAAGTR